MNRLCWPEISWTWPSASVYLLMKLAVIAMASFPRNSFRLNPTTVNLIAKKYLFETWEDTKRYDTFTNYNGGGGRGRKKTGWSN